MRNAIATINICAPHEMFLLLRQRNGDALIKQGGDKIKARSAIGIFVTELSKRDAEKGLLAKISACSAKRRNPLIVARSSPGVILGIFTVS